MSASSEASPFAFGAVWLDRSQAPRKYVFLGQHPTLDMVFLLYWQPGDWWGAYQPTTRWLRMVECDLERVR